MCGLAPDRMYLFILLLAAHLVVHASLRLRATFHVTELMNSLGLFHSPMHSEKEEEKAGLKEEGGREKLRKKMIKQKQRGRKGGRQRLFLSCPSAQIRNLFVCLTYTAACPIHTNTHTYRKAHQHAAFVLLSRSLSFP